MDINQVITGELGVKRWQVDAAVKLIDEGNTIPFIARYRKEVTGTLDDAQLRTLHERLMYLRNLEEKKEQVLASIEEQGKLTEELKKQGVTIFMISHDIEFCASYADRCGLFFDGNIAASGTPKSFFAGNNFYTTAANRMARKYFPMAVTAADVAEALLDDSRCV